MAFEYLEALFKQAVMEQAGLDAATATLDGARGELTAAQSVVTEKQPAVTAALAAVNSEKADVVNVLTQMHAAISEYLASLG